jgi:7-cyano-7-deazaguanine synthase
MNKRTSALVVISGGMDSTTLLYKAVAEFRSVEAISFNYGQRHRKELKYAAKSCKALGINHTIVDVSALTKLISNSALTSDIKVPEGHYESESMKLTVVPNRNMIMASIAIGYAVNKKIDYVALGVHAGDRAQYPDCTPEFIEALTAIAKIANYYPVKIWAPLLLIDKGDIAIIGKKLGVNYANSWTCYVGGDKPCMKCGACNERTAAFVKADMKDPLYSDKEWEQAKELQAKVQKEFNKTHA